MKRILFIFVFVFCASLTAQAAVDPSGDYVIKRGVDPDDAEYTGTVTIKDKGHGLYDVTWVVKGVKFHGVGFVRDGDLDVAYSNDPFFGLAVYQVDSGRLTGERISTETKFEPGYENLQGLLPWLEGVHMITDAQASDGGVKYSGMAEIHAFEDVYYLSYNAAGAAYDGIGLLEGGRLIVGWGAQMRSEVGVMRYKIKDNELEGRWAMAGHNRTGIEELVRTSPVRQVNRDITIEGLTKNIEKALSQINDMTHDYALRYRPKNGSVTENKDLIVATMFYKKPNLVRDESTTLYLTTGPQKHSYIIKLEGANFNVYELLGDGSVTMDSHSAKGWEKSGYIPGSIYVDIKKRIKDGETFTIDHWADSHVYILKFDSPDEAAFEISDQSWIPYARTVLDQEQGTIVQTEWTNIKINTGIDDKMFIVPQSAKAHK